MTSLSGSALPERSRLCVLCLLALCLLLSCDSADAAGVKFTVPRKAESPEKQKKLQSFWQPTVAMLSDVIEEEQFRLWLQSASALAVKQNVPLDVCGLNVVRCDDTHGVMSVAGLRIQGMHTGSIHWDKVPASVKDVLLLDCSFSQDFALSDIPAGVERFEARSVSWTSAEEGTPLSLRVFRAGASASQSLSLKSFRCTACNFASIQLDTADCGSGCLAKAAPQLTAFEYTNSAALQTLPFEQLPRNLESVTLSDLPQWRAPSEVTMETLFRHFTESQKLAFGGVPVTFRLGHLSAVSQSLRELAVFRAPVSAGAAAETSNGAAAVGQDVAELQSALAQGSAAGIMKLRISGYGLHGAFPDLTAARTLSLDLSDNALGEVPFSRLPTGLQKLNISGNGIAGPIPSLSELPPSLTALDLSRNSLTGELDFTMMPKSLQLLDVSGNQLSGPVDTTKLPDTARFVYLQNNRFTGQADLVDLPVLLKRILVHNNNWDAPMPAK